jgi:hypothetical protein
MSLHPYIKADSWADPAPSLAAKLAAFFRRHPNTWHDRKLLGQIAGGYAWRTRVSDLRRPPFNMVIENRQRQVEVSGEAVTISEYRFRVQELTLEEGAAASGQTGCSHVGTP